MIKRYWNGNGEEQKIYKEMLNADFQFTKKSLDTVRAYYRYYNDGDIPRWGYGKTDIQIEKELEIRATDMIRHEYKRFIKSQK